MDDDSAHLYEQLANALDKLPNGFPRTSGGAEIRILRKIFSPEEASLASQLGASAECLENIAVKTKLTREDATRALDRMAERGLVWFSKKEGKPAFRLAPFIVGIYESQLYSLDHELAHLLEEYLSDGGAAGIMKPEPALHRVIPAQQAVKLEWILPYDDVKLILSQMKTFHLRDCICRKQQELLSHKCSFPMRTCLSFSSIERPAHPLDVSKQQALAFLDETEKIGLVHTVSNVIKGLGYVCNCCGCCCGILRGITQWGIEKSVAHANYRATIAEDECVNCGTCRERCQVHAITEQNGGSFVDPEKCIGCGLCVTGCPTGAAKLNRKAENEIVEPPVNFETWEHERLHNRGLSNP